MSEFEANEESLQPDDHRCLVRKTNSMCDLCLLNYIRLIKIPQELSRISAITRFADGQIQRLASSKVACVNVADAWGDSLLPHGATSFFDS